MKSTRAGLLTVFGLFLGGPGDAAATRKLIGSMAAMGIDEANVRRSLSRLAERGLVAATREGRESIWSLTDKGRVTAGERDLRIFGSGDAPAWDGQWLMLSVSVPDDRRQLRYALQTRLGWAGFGTLRSGLWISPHPERVDQASSALRDLGLEGDARMFSGVPLGGTTTADLVADAWELDSLGRRYEEFTERYDPAIAADDAERFSMLVAMFDEWLALLAADPELPAELLPPGWSGHAARQAFEHRHGEWLAGASAWFAAL